MTRMSTMSFRGGLAVSFTVALALGACGHAAGTGPHEMSAAAHQAAAEHEHEQGTAHSEEYDATSREKRKRCAPALATNQSRVCWNEYVNPTSEHEATSQRRRELAAQHRAASQALISAEDAACAGLEGDDRDVSPFAHAGDIARVQQLKAEMVRQGGPESGRDVGATVTFRAVPGLTAPWLQRIIDCHLARNAALGHALASREMPHCPLTLTGVRATAREAGSGFAVEVRSDDPPTAAEIWRRAQRLAPGR